MGEESEQYRKIFIGGLHYQTTDESLRQFYEKWGEVVDCVVMRDPYTRKSRGFGFITYSRADMVDICLDARPHVIDGKQVDPKRAMPREDSNKPEAHLAVKKIFVGGVKEALSDEDLQNYFGSFGNIQSIEMITDRETGRKRGFGFITFDDCDTVDKIVLRKNHTVNGIQIEVKKAMEKDQMNAMSTRGGGGGGRGAFAGRGGSRGRGAAGASRGRGGGAGGSYGASDGYGAGAGGYGADGYGGGYGSGSYGGSSGYGGGYNDGYGGGYSGGSGGWGQGGGYGNGYGSGSSGGAGFGSGYSGSYGGGAMKSSGGYSQRGSGPYGGYGSGSAGGGYGSGASGYGGGYGGY